MSDKTETPAKRGISRRTVVAGTAWAVPAIVVAGPAPHAAATVIPPITIGGTACKLPGNSGAIKNGVAFQLFLSNPNTQPVTVFIDSVTKSGDVAPAQIIPSSVVVPGKTTNQSSIVLAGPYNDSSNASVTITYHYTDPVTNKRVDGQAGPTTVNIVPVQGAQCPFVIPG